MEEHEAIAIATHKFGINQMKEEQKTILDCLLRKQDCMAVLPTGYGKSLPYQMLPTVKQLMDPHSNNVVLVCCPLLALMQDQVTKLKALGVALRGDSEDDEKIKSGTVDMLFSSPESLLGNSTWRSAIQSLDVDTIVIDEFHTMVTWGGLDQTEEESAFRKWFRHIGELRSLFPSATLLALSATCTKKMRKTVRQALNLSKEGTYYIIKSPNKENIKLHVMKVEPSIEMAMLWVVECLISLKESFPRTILYCFTIQQLSSIFNYVCLECADLNHLVDICTIQKLVMTKKQR